MDSSPRTGARSLVLLTALPVLLGSTAWSKAPSRPERSATAAHAPPSPGGGPASMAAGGGSSGTGGLTKRRAKGITRSGAPSNTTGG